MTIINNFIAYLKGDELTFKQFKFNTIIVMIISIIVVSYYSTYLSDDKMSPSDIFITLPFGLWVFNIIKVDGYRKYLENEPKFEEYSRQLTRPTSFALYYTIIMLCVLGILAGLEFYIQLSEFKSINHIYN